MFRFLFVIFFICTAGCSRNPYLETEVLRMDDVQFWSIIDDSKSGGNDQLDQAVSLKNSLQTLTPHEVAQFQSAFEDALNRSYTWDLWGAAYIIRGGCSDDCFDYFRYWLIAQGEDVFIAAVSNPETLAEFISKHAVSGVEFEEFYSIGWDVWCAKTGLDWDDVPKTSYPYADGPSGEPFAEDPKSLSTRFPILWKHFGDTPL